MWRGWENVKEAVIFSKGDIWTLITDSDLRINWWTVIFLFVCVCVYLPSCFILSFCSFSLFLTGSTNKAALVSWLFRLFYFQFFTFSFVYSICLIKYSIYSLQLLNFISIACRKLVKARKNKPITNWYKSLMQY